MNTRVFHLPRIATPLAITLCIVGPTFGQASSSKSSSTTNPSPSSSSSSSRPAGSSSTYDSSSSRATTGTTSMNSAAGADKLAWSDRRFVTKTADGGQDEVQLARLAVQKASNPDVRSFAERLVKDHTQMNSELMSIARQKNLKVDQEENKDRTYKRLSARSGDEFDREFIEHMVDEHEKDIKMFEKAASEAKDTDVRGFASKHVAQLREHLQQAQRLQQSIVPTGRMNSDSSTSSSRPDTSSATSPATSSSTSRPSTISSPKAPSSSSTIPDPSDPTASGKNSSNPPSSPSK